MHTSRQASSCPWRHVRSWRHGYKDISTVWPRLVGAWQSVRHGAEIPTPHRGHAIKQYGRHGCRNVRRSAATNSAPSSSTLVKLWTRQGWQHSRGFCLSIKRRLDALAGAAVVNTAARMTCDGSSLGVSRRGTGPDASTALASGQIVLTNVRLVPPRCTGSTNRSTFRCDGAICRAGAGARVRQRFPRQSVLSSAEDP